MTRVRASLAVLSAALVALALIAAPPASAAPSATTTVPDSTYGQGGTKEQSVNERHDVIAETWRDAHGVVRERFEPGDDGAQYWAFYVGEGSSDYVWGGMIEIRPIGGLSAGFQMTVLTPGSLTLKEYGFLTKDELDREFAYWRDQMRSWVNGFIRGSG